METIILSNGKVIEYSSCEELPAFLKMLKNENESCLYPFNRFLNHYSIERFEPNTVYIYPYVENDIKIKIENTIMVYSYLVEDAPGIFFDVPTSLVVHVIDDPTGASAVKIVTEQDDFIGYYIIPLNTLLLCDITHDEDCIKPAIRLFQELCSRINTTRESRPKDVTIKSQKAQSILFLAKIGEAPPTVAVTPNNMQLDHLAKVFPIHNPSNKIVLRACPETPRHGVMENIILESPSQHEVELSIRKMFKQARDYNEPEEVIIQKFIQSVCSAVIVPEKMLTIGPGNDGVTAGKENQVTLTNIPVKLPYSYWIEDLGLDVAEIEAVLAQDTNRVYYTQIRKAPEHVVQESIKPKGGLPGFVPNHKFVELDKVNIIIVRGLTNIGELEKHKENVLCIHIDGSLVSHASAWCRQNKLAYIALESENELVDIVNKKYLVEVASGWVVATDENPNDIESDIEIELYPHFNNFLNGLYTALESVLSRGNYPMLLEGIIYFQYYITGNCQGKIGAYLAGLFLGGLIKISQALLYGELRHALKADIIKCHLSTIVQQFAHGTIQIPLSKDYGTILNNRDYVYDFYLCKKLSLRKIAKLAKAAFFCFYFPKWESGYGGKKWAKIASGLLGLATALERKEYDSALKYANKFVNLVHNNGWFLNKVASSSILALPYKDNDTMVKEAMHFYGKMKNKFIDRSPVKGLPLPKYILEEAENVVNNIKYRKGGE